MDLILDKELKLSEQIFDARFHPDPQNDLIAAVTIAGNVNLVESGAVKSKLRKHHKGTSIRKVRFSPDGRMLTIAKTVKIHDLNSNETSATLRRNDGRTSTFYSLAPLSNDVVCAGDDDGAIFVWDHRAKQEPIFSSSDCEQYISDIDGRYEAKKLIICTSGEGTLTAYDMRNMKMVEPQSELFEAGFQCVKWTDNKKIVIGGEDGAVYIFNQNEWAHPSGKFSMGDDSQNRGKCSIDGIDALPGESTFVAACSDGRLRLFALWPHELLCERALCKKRPLESVHVDTEEKSQIVVSGDEFLALVKYETKEDDEMKSDSESASTDSGSAESSHADEISPNTNVAQQNKKANTDEGDYLDIFK